MSWLYSSFTENRVAQIVSCNTAFEIWSSLERTYATTNHSRIIELRTELQNIKKDGLSADEYILKLRSVVDKLASIGEPVSHNDQNIYLLRGIWPQYNSFADIINARSGQPDIDEIHSLLLACDLRLQRQNSVEQLNLPQPFPNNLNPQANLSNFQPFKKHQAQKPYQNFSQNQFSRPQSQYSRTLSLSLALTIQINQIF